MYYVFYLVYIFCYFVLSIVLHLFTVQHFGPVLAILKSFINKVGLDWILINSKSCSAFTLICSLAGNLYCLEQMRSNEGKTERSIVTVLPGLHEEQGTQCTFE